MKTLILLSIISFTGSVNAQQYAPLFPKTFEEHAQRQAEIVLQQQIQDMVRRQQELLELQRQANPVNPFLYHGGVQP